MNGTMTPISPSGQPSRPVLRHHRPFATRPTQLDRQGDAAAAVSWPIVVLATCGVVLTGAMLGMKVLEEPVLGVPGGLWLVLGSGLAAWARGNTHARIFSSSDFGAQSEPEYKGNAHDTFVSDERATTTVSMPTSDQQATPAAACISNGMRPIEPRKFPRRKKSARRLDSPKSGWLSHVVDTAVGGAAGALGHLSPTWLGDSGGGSVADWLDQRASGHRPLRVGLRLDHESASRVVGDLATPDVSWLGVQDEGRGERVCRERSLDALVAADENGNLSVFTPERPGHEAGWYDLGVQRPVSYFSVFPMRLDCARITLEGEALSLCDWPEVRLRAMRSLVRSAAMLSRHPSRLTMRDRLAGRRSTILPLGAQTDPANASIMDLAIELNQHPQEPGSVERASSRLVSAWLSTHAEGLTEPERCALSECAATIAGDEAEVVLRTAAVRLTMLDENLGIDAILRADRMLRARGGIGGLELLTLIEAELEHGTYGDMTVGRAAAGICMACARTPSDRIAYIREDLFEDMRYAGWLVGRDPERKILIEVCRQLERAHRAESFGLPRPMRAA